MPNPEVVPDIVLYAQARDLHVWPEGLHPKLLAYRNDGSASFYCAMERSGSAWLVTRDGEAQHRFWCIPRRIARVVLWVRRTGRATPEEVERALREGDEQWQRWELECALRGTP
jgi:hypothetical protein